MALTQVLFIILVLKPNVGLCFELTLVWKKLPSESSLV